MTNDSIDNNTITIGNKYQQCVSNVYTWEENFFPQKELKKNPFSTELSVIYS